jgi:Fic-DOC domain mobile mystery protein B
MDGQTPLDDDEKEGLRILTIATRGELDEFEQQNIEQAIQWTMTRSFKQEMILSENFIRNVHKRMYGEVWAWAGQLRKTDTNIGADNHQIPILLRVLLGDASYWIENSSFPPDEIAVRFKHRLVCIHCFPNGNGRHSRLIADIIVGNVFKRPVFTWGAARLVKNVDSRKEYLQALKSADKGEFGRLLEFARS